VCLVDSENPLGWNAEYEDGEFYSAWAELGIMVWQDAMLATTDPPDDPHVHSLLEDEVRALARRWAGNPAPVVMCGGSETEQQPAMLGLREASTPALDDWLPVIVDRELPGTVWVSSSPPAPPRSDALPIAVVRVWRTTSASGVTAVLSPTCVLPACASPPNASRSRFRLPTR
jgi:hypothetical protein